MNKCNNVESDPRYKLAEKIFLETGTDLPMLIWNEMSKEELEAYYQDLRNREKRGMTISDVADSIKGSVNTAANVIYSLRSLSGLSQKAFSDKYGIPKRTIEDWESGKRTPPEYVVKLLKRVVKEDIEKEGL